MASAPAGSAAAPGTYAATLYPTTKRPLTVSQFYSAAQPTCPVALCFSGGGSRAMTAAIGQLQALEAVQANGASLLSQARVISTVSGGSWIGVPFVYSAAGTDTDFLGSYLPPEKLTISLLGQLQPGGIAQQITSGFSPPAMAVKALLLYHDGVPMNMLWQTIVALHMLAPFGLYQYKQGSYTPISFFTLDNARAQSIRNQSFPGVPTQNGSLSATAYVVAEIPAEQRPYLVCNTAVLVTDTAEAAAFAPVQVTPVMTGVVAQPPAKDCNGLAVGGGGVESFAFNSTPHASSGGAVATFQQREWNLIDAVGSSSAFFAAVVEEHIKTWRVNPAQFAADIGVHGPPAIAFLERYGVSRARGEQLLSKLAASSILRDADALQAELSGLEDLAPQYINWPASAVPQNETLKPSYFADGGNLENSGIASALAYSDITTVIAFANSMTKLAAGNNQQIIVDSMIPPLFGLRPYDHGTGTYPPYANAGKPSSPDLRNNCVFELSPSPGANTFDDLLQGLWNASGGGKYNGAAIYQQTLTTVDNPWFGVTGGRQVTVLWVYLEYNSAWQSAMTDELVRLKVDALRFLEGFPHYDTLHTELSASDINLMASFTAWTIESGAAMFRALFPPPQQLSSERRVAGDG